ncbi:unnamed protein product [Microthlaspi erraticum]|uniref:Uncharacterized protein n=1 Tax=Microthlaspi erraticum TaxID=1685480 RepID=A0A6D2JJK5_9BRAS|nr:unnamed protein product [Microthlaspi erraticum]CAA7037028.1 unnamed protein product [Microthlaspi erraticum]
MGVQSDDKTKLVHENYALPTLNVVLATNAPPQLYSRPLISHSKTQHNQEKELDHNPTHTSAEPQRMSHDAKLVRFDEDGLDASPLKN